MVKRKQVDVPPVNKSAAVRDYLASRPDAKNKEVIAALAEKGVAVTPNYVSVIRGGGRKKAGPKSAKLAKPGILNDVLRREKAVLLKRVTAIDTLLG